MNQYITYGNRTYYLDVNKMIEFCLKSENKNVRDSEIISTNGTILLWIIIR